MRECKAEYEAYGQRHRRGDEPASADQQAKKKNYARKHSSKAWCRRSIGFNKYMFGSDAAAYNAGMSVLCRLAEGINRLRL